MKKKKTKPDIDALHNETVPAFGYELLREILIPELLGEEQTAILYWSGKNLARQYPLESVEDMIHFFLEAGWGQLSVRDTNKQQMTFQLESERISRQLQLDKKTSFAMETGFLAQQIQRLENCPADANEYGKKGRILITAEWDRKDTLDPTLSMYPARSSLRK